MSLAVQWIVNDLGNKTYQVTNVGQSGQNAFSSVSAGSAVKGDSSSFAWTISELNPGTYRFVDISQYAKTGV